MLTVAFVALVLVPAAALGMVLALARIEAALFDEEERPAPHPGEDDGAAADRE
ncbi:hypothetical protein ACWGH8_19965 [Nonomuraea muscovyensis]|uniref:hypothetical protein n=1 Tax=Nonomuraea muscovyensis TaxID=1124761 RepID=UPI0033FE619A